MNEANLGIREIGQANERTLMIQWSDGIESSYDVVELRRRCPCALCIDEWTNEPKLKPEDVADTVRPKRIDSVGRYAIKISYDDQHSTGIYTYKMLRELGS